MHSCYDKEHMKRFFGGTLNEEELLAFAEHLSICSVCSEVLSDTFDESACVMPTIDFAERVRRQISGSKKKEFRRYCVEVAVSVCAACAAVFLLAAQVDRTPSVLEVIKPTNIVHQIDKAFSIFSNNILLEVDNFDKEK